MDLRHDPMENTPKINRSQNFQRDKRVENHQTNFNEHEIAPPVQLEETRHKIEDKINGKKEFILNSKPENEYEYQKSGINFDPPKKKKKRKIKRIDRNKIKNTLSQEGESIQLSSLNNIPKIETEAEKFIENSPNISQVKIEDSNSEYAQAQKVENTKVTGKVQIFSVFRRKC